MADAVTIERLGHRGDGIFSTPAGSGYVSFTLPGERVLIKRAGERGRLIDIIEPSPARVDPLCRHFGVCGSCALQMMPLAETRRFKRELVVQALAREGVNAEIGETIGIDPASRRRVGLTALRAGKRILFGFNERLSNRIVDIEECPVMAPALAAHVPAIRALLAPLTGGRSPARVTALATITGIDLDVGGVKPPPSAVIAKLPALARSAAVARLSIGHVPLLTLVELSGVRLAPPPGAFLQASTEAETIMAQLVAGHLAGARRIADLFCGLGTFAFALAKKAQVTAVESNQPALDALASAMRAATSLKRIGTERRDLFAHPLSPEELDVFDGVVFDPPRAGAKAQAATLAMSKVPRVAAVSCNPGSFARDARLLVDGGYFLERVIPVDQFVYSAETEVVGLFSRPAR